VVNLAPDSAMFAVTTVSLSVAIWIGIELFLFDQFRWTNALSGAACGIALVLVNRWMHETTDR
jgi:hypothetical protein